MEIFIEDIPPEGLEIDATEADPWLSAIVGEAAGEAFKKGDKAVLHLELQKVGDNVSIDGEVNFSSHPPCDRCLVEFEEPLSFPFHTLLAPLYESARQERIEKGMEVELVREDLEFSFYEGDRIDLDEIVREQVLLNQPMKHLCSEGCKGLCQRCGKDLNAGPCNCEEKKADRCWEALKGIKLGDGSARGASKPIAKAPRSGALKAEAAARADTKTKVRAKGKTKAKTKTMAKKVVGRSAKAAVKATGKAQKPKGKTQKAKGRKQEAKGKGRKTRSR